MKNTSPKKLSKQGLEFMKSLMANPSIESKYSQQTINLIYVLTMDEIVRPVRNKGCHDSKVCVWPFETLIKQFSNDVIEHKRINKQTNFDIKHHSYICSMCQENNRCGKKKYSDFYQDRKLNFLILAAKEKYIQSLQDQPQFQTSQRVRKKILKQFKYSKLLVYKGGGAILEYKKKTSFGYDICRKVVFQNTLANCSEQLIFNPIDKTNQSYLKIAQSICQVQIGDTLDKGLQLIKICYSKSSQQKIKILLEQCINEAVNNNLQLSVKQQQLYTAKFIRNQFNKTHELAIFYPRVNLTQIYAFQQNKLFLECNKKILKITKLPKLQLLLYASDRTFILKLKPQNMQYRQKNFSREVTIFDSNMKYKQKSLQIQNVKYPNQILCYQSCNDFNVYFDSVRPQIISPIFISNPQNEGQIYLIGGSMQGNPNHHVYLFQIQHCQRGWAKQEYNLQRSFQQNCQLIIEMGRIFVLIFPERQGQYLSIIQLKITNHQLSVKRQHIFLQNIEIRCAVALRIGDNEYFLIDPKSIDKQIYNLNLSQMQIKKNYSIKKNIFNSIIQLLSQSQQFIKSSPACSTIYNQVNYNLIYKKTSKYACCILYGCRDSWLVSQSEQTLIHD